MGFFYQGSYWVIACSRSLQAVGLSVLPLLIKSQMYVNTKRVKLYMMWRQLLSGLSGPFMTILLGYILHFYNWRICYLLIGVIYLLALLWFYFKLANLDLARGHAKSLKEQLSTTFSILKHRRLVLLAFCGILTMSINVFLLSVYAFVFLHDFHIPVYYIGYIPLVFAFGDYAGMLLVLLLNNFSKDKCVLRLFVIQSIILFLFMFFPKHEWVVIIIWMLLLTAGGMLYIYLNEVMAKMAKELNKVVQFNTLYYFLKNFIPLIAVLVWAHFSRSRNLDIVAEIILFFGLGSFFLLRRRT